MNEERVKGRCVWFKDSLGYGFIHVDGQPNDIFIHYSNINGEGFKTLKPDQQVEFEIEMIEGKGRHAVNLNIIE